jgi:DNA-directed RNA polymerase sigma subunit (sigma70/sigma32)
MFLFFAVDKHKLAMRALDQISDFQADVLKFLFKVSQDNASKKASYEEAARHFDLSPEAIEAIEVGALRSLRKSRVN